MQSKSPSRRELQKFFSSGNSKRRNPETDIVKACIDFLNICPGVRCWRVNVGAMESVDEEGRKRFVRFGQAGMADISGIAPDGRRIEIEIKCPGKKPRPDQEAWLRMIVEAGGVGFWCDSLDGCIEQARKWGLGS